MIADLIFILLAYLFGSLSCAIIVSRIFSLPDPRSEGSKNPGATNVLRLAGKKFALIVLLGDMLKGFIPVLLAKLCGLDSLAVSFVAFAAVLGHVFPLFFGLEGGKGVATTLGALLGINFLLAVMVIATWLLIANFSRYSSLASICSLLLAPFYSLFTMENSSAFVPLAMIALFVIYKHRENITRLMDGTESKINFKRKAS